LLVLLAVDGNVSCHSDQASQASTVTTTSADSTGRPAAAQTDEYDFVCRIVRRNGYPATLENRAEWCPLR